MKFSILIPTYKSTFLKDTIDSCLAQTYREFELIIVDDFSTDPIKAIVDRYSDKRVRYYRNSKNCGAVNVVDNWNICLAYAQGEYAICMGDDDLLLPNCLEVYNKLINQYPGIDVIHGWTQLIDENSKVFEIQAARPLFESAYSLLWNRWNTRHRQYIGDFCYNIKSLREKGGFYKLPLGWASDDITAVIMAENKGIINSQSFVFQYRVNAQSISRSANDYFKLDAIIEEKKWYKQFLKKEPSDFVDKVYKKMICSQFNYIFECKMNKYLWQALYNNPKGFYYCLKNCRKYGIPAHKLFRKLINVLKYKMLHLF